MQSNREASKQAFYLKNEIETKGNLGKVQQKFESACMYELSLSKEKES